MSLLLLVRHGQAVPQAYAGHQESAGSVVSGGRGAGLTDLGRRQASLLGNALTHRGISPSRVVTGGLDRQTETADVCLSALGYGSVPDPERDGRWREYDIGNLLAAYPALPASGERAAVDRPAPQRDAREFQDLLDGALRCWMSDADPPAALGSWTAFTGGARDALVDAAAGTPRGATTMIVTSAGPIVSAVAGLMCLSDEGFLRLHRVVLNGSLTKLIAGRRGIHLLSVNEHAHLDDGDAELATYR